MNIYFKITDDLLNEIKRDLARPHDFAYERVGFISCRVGKVNSSDWIILASTYIPVEDGHYIEGHSAGATIGSDAIRKMLQTAYDNPVSIVHIHEHPHYGKPCLSGIDQREMNKLIPNFWHVRPDLPHAAIVISKDSICGFAWEPTTKKELRLKILQLSVRQ